MSPSKDAADLTDSRSAPSTPDRDYLETPLRALLAFGGTGLLVVGVITALTAKEGTATAALMAAGFALLLVSYVGSYITRIRFRDLEVEIERFRNKTTTTLQEVQNKATETLKQLEDVSRSYKEVRAEMSPGGKRDSEMERQVTDAMRVATDLPLDEVRKIF